MCSTRLFNVRCIGYFRGRQPLACAPSGWSAGGQRDILFVLTIRRHGPSQLPVVAVRRSWPVGAAGSSAGHRDMLPAAPIGWKRRTTATADGQHGRGVSLPASGLP